MMVDIPGTCFEACVFVIFFWFSSFFLGGYTLSSIHYGLYVADNSSARGHRRLLSYAHRVQHATASYCSYVEQIR